MDSQKFKQCTFCQKWLSLQDIFENPELHPKGITFVNMDFNLNTFFFDHKCDNCGTTLGIKARDLLPLITEPVPPKIITGEADCEGHCLELEDHDECKQDCFYAPFRRLLQVMIDNREKLNKGESVSVSRNG